MKMSGKQFSASTVAQDDDQDYSESGYVVCVNGDIASVFNYFHCSCYGTWKAISGSYEGDSEMDVTPLWEGTVGDLAVKAQAGECLVFPGRLVADTDDYDKDHLLKVYQDYLVWYNTKRVSGGT